MRKATEEHSYKHIKQRLSRPRRGQTPDAFACRGNHVFCDVFASCSFRLVRRPTFLGSRLDASAPACFPACNCSASRGHIVRASPGFGLWYGSPHELWVLVPEQLL